MNFLDEELLKSVSRPGRYCGGEFGEVKKDLADVKLRFAFCFPDLYDIGMSNLGMRILQGCLNQIPEVFCERVFMPWIDMHDKMRERGIKLYALETGTPVDEFDIVGFTMQYELCYTNVLEMLKMSGIPLFARDRGEDSPIILGGGPCAYNAEPVADFFDILSIGEGEEALPELCRVYLKMKEEGSYTKKAFLLAAAQIPGFYVPSLYDITYKEDGRIEKITPLEGAPAIIKKRVIHDLNTVYFPTAPIVPSIETVQDRITLEVFRGCIRGCRFCQAGMVNRPLREKSVETLNSCALETYKNTGYGEISLSALSVSDYSHINELCDTILDWSREKKVSLSLPSLRVDNFTKELMDKALSVRSSGLTFAPEAGSQRLRNVINKNVFEEDLIRTLTIAADAGKSSVKLYFMQGLPTETDEDIKAIAELAKKALSVFLKSPRRKRPPSVTISVACFIPKPFTPFQWEKQDDLEGSRRKQELLRSELKDRRISYNWHDAKTSFIEAVFARGDRRLSAVLAEANAEGVIFDAWDECFDFEKWMKIFEKCGTNPAFYASREREEDEVLPWDMLDCGVSKGYLLKERGKSREQ